METRLTLSATQLVVTSPPPAAVVAGQNFGLSVSAEDATGAVDTTFDGEVTVSGVGTPDGTATAAAVGGVASFSGLTLDTAGSAILFLGTPDGSLSSTTTAPIAVTASTATHLVVISPPPATVTAGAGFGLVLAAGDAYGNVDPSFIGSVTLALQNNPGGGSLAGLSAVPFSNGVASFSGLTVDAAGSGYTLLATSKGLAPTLSGSLGFGVTAAAATQMVVTTPPPTTVAAGQDFGLGVTVEDQYGNPVTGFVGDLAIAPSSSQVEGNLGGILTAPVVGGVASFTGLSLTRPGAALTLQVSASGLPSATTDPFTVTAGQATQLVVTTPPPTVEAGVGFGLVLAAEDAYGNVDPAFSGTVTLALASDLVPDTLVGTTTLPLSAGLVTFSGLNLFKASSSAVLQATSLGLRPASPSALTLAVTAGPATQLVLMTPPPSTVEANAAFGLVLAAEDAYGNVSPAFSGAATVALASNPGGSVLGGTTIASFSEGLATFAGLTLNEPGQGYTLVAFSNGLAPSPSLGAMTLGVTAAATQLAVISAPPADVTAGQVFGLTVAVEDDSGRVDTAFSGSVVPTLADGPGGGTLSGGTSVNIINGVATFSGLTIDQAGTGYALQVATAGLPPAITPLFNVSAAAASKLVVTSPPPPVIGAGALFGLTVAVEDTYGNPVTGFIGNLAVSPSNVATEGSLGGLVTAPIFQGVATFIDLSLDKPGSDFTLQVSGTGLPSVTTSPFVVTSAQATELVVTSPPPSTVAAGAGFGLQVSAEDSYGNVDPTFSGTVIVSLVSDPWGTTLGGTLAASAVGGVATFAGLTLGASTGVVDLELTSGGLVSTTAGPLVVSSSTASSGNSSSSNSSGGNASSGSNSSGSTSSGSSSTSSGTADTSPLLVISSQPSTVDAGRYFSLTVVAEDAGGVADTSFNGTVSLALAGNPGGATLGGNLTMPIYHGLLTFYGLTLNVAGPGYTIRAMSSGFTSAVSSAITVVDPPVTLAVTGTPPSSVAVGQAFGLTVSVVDIFGNLGAGYDGDVTIALAGNHGRAKLRGPLTVRAVEGVASFSGLSLTGARKGSSVRIEVAANGLAATTSGPFLVASARANRLVKSRGHRA